MKIIGITKKSFTPEYGRPYSAYYMSYQVNDNCFVIKIQAKQFKELKKNGIPTYSI